jgi:hypothetical protein
MKKIYLSIILAGLSFSELNAQVQMKPHTFGTFDQVSSETVTIKPTVRPKSIAWSEDFDISTTGPGSTSGPTFVTSTGTWTATGEWKHSFVTTDGTWSNNTPAFTSTTASNGFMLFDSDSLNTDFTVTPVAMVANPIGYTGELISPSIDLTLETSVLLVLEQDFRYCCATGPHNLGVAVSSDAGVTWSTPYDLTEGVVTNDSYSSITGTYDVSVNITADAAGNTIMLKFIWDGVAAGKSHYFWNFDDVYITQALPNEIVALEPYWGSEFLHYYQIPTTQVTQIDFSVEPFNNGANTQTNVTLNVDINAGAFTGTSASVTIPPVSSDSLFLPSGYTPALVVGSHDVVWNVTQDSIDDNPGNNLIPNITFNVTDYIYARDENLVDGTQDNDGEGYEVGNLFDIWADQVVKGIDFRLSSTTNIGSLLYAKIYSIDGNGDFFLEEQTNYYEITAADLNTIVTLELLNPLLLTTTLQTYLVVVATDGDGGVTNDVVVSTSGVSEPQTSFYYDATDVTWYYTTRTPIVRFNFDPTLSLEESNELGLTLYPNPSSDNITIDYNLLSASDVTVEVVDITGNTIFSATKDGQSSGVQTSSVNTSGFASGVYYVTVSTEGASVTKKFVKK